MHLNIRDAEAAGKEETTCLFRRREKKKTSQSHHAKLFPRHTFHCPYFISYLCRSWRLKTEAEVLWLQKPEINPAGARLCPGRLCMSQHARTPHRTPRPVPHGDVKLKRSAVWGGGGINTRSSSSSGRKEEQEKEDEERVRYLVSLALTDNEAFDLSGMPRVWSFPPIVLRLPTRLSAHAAVPNPLLGSPLSQSAGLPPHACCSSGGEL